MTNKWVKTSKRMMFLYFTLGGLIFLFSPPRLTGKLQLAYARVFSWPLTTGRELTLASRTALPPEASSPSDYARAMDTYRQLQERLAKLEAQHRKLQNHLANREAQLEEAQQKIDKLARLRTVPEWGRMSFQQAGIISVSGQGQSELLIDRGQEDGLAIGQYVLGDLSMIGVVSDVSAQTARIKLITDPTSRIPVRIAELDAQGLMEGRGSGAAEISGVRDRPKRQPQAGDRVYALRTPGFPSVPIVTAEVVDSRRDLDNPMLWSVRVKPVCDIASLTDVAIIISGR
jgi:cell shape-determining protein MreC